MSHKRCQKRTPSLVTPPQHVTFLWGHPATVAVQDRGSGIDKIFDEAFQRKYDKQRIHRAAPAFTGRPFLPR
jgi:hypothetical protein